MSGIGTIKTTKTTKSVGYSKKVGGTVKRVKRIMKVKTNK